MTTETLTDRERQCLEHLQQAQTLGVTLTEYAETFALDVKALYSGKQQLVKKGVLPAPTTPEPEKSAFVTVRVAPPSAPGRGSVVCRVLHASGHVIECSDWPPTSWMAALLAGAVDAAT
jgi:hypothetical protein